MLQNANVCNSVKQLLTAQNMQEQEVMLYCAKHYIMLHDDDTANVLYFNNIEEQLSAMLQVYNIAKQRNNNMHEMLIVCNTLYNNAHVKQFVNAHNMECEVV